MSADYMDICEKLSRENETLRAQVAALEARLREAGEQKPVEWAVVNNVGTRFSTLFSEGAANAYIAMSHKETRHLLRVLPRYAAPVPAQPAADRLPPDAVIPTLDELREILKTDEQSAVPEAVAVAKDALEELLLHVEEPPDSNCSCHISPPCSDCVNYSGLRSAINTARAILSATDSEGRKDE